MGIRAQPIIAEGGMLVGEIGHQFSGV